MGDDPMAVRDKAMFELCYSSGLRLAELTDMKPEDLSHLTVPRVSPGKAGKTRIVRLAARRYRRWANG